MDPGVFCLRQIWVQGAWSTWRALLSQSTMLHIFESFEEQLEGCGGIFIRYEFCSTQKSITFIEIRENVLQVKQLRNTNRTKKKVN